MLWKLYAYTLKQRNIFSKTACSNEYGVRTSRRPHGLFLFVQLMQCLARVVMGMCGWVLYYRWTALAAIRPWKARCCGRRGRTQKSQMSEREHELMAWAWAGWLISPGLIGLWPGMVCPSFTWGGCAWWMKHRGSNLWRSREHGSDRLLQSMV